MSSKMEPFLWNFIKEIQIPKSSTGGEEKIITESVNEENQSGIARIIIP